MTKFKVGDRVKIYQGLEDNHIMPCCIICSAIEIPRSDVWIPGTIENITERDIFLLFDDLQTWWNPDFSQDERTKRWIIASEKADYCLELMDSYQAITINEDDERKIQFE